MENTEPMESGTPGDTTPPASMQDIEPQHEVNSSWADIDDESTGTMGERKRKGGTKVSSFVNKKFRLSSGSFSSSGSFTSLSTSLEKFQELLKNPPKPKSIMRGPSLMRELSAGVAEMVGSKKRMEDRHEVSMETLQTSPKDVRVQKEDQGQDQLQVTADTPMTQIPHAFFGVYDGHGGSKAAEFVAQKLHKAVVDNPYFDSNVEEALRTGFRQVEDQLTEKVLKENWDGLTGTTVCVALIEGNHLYIANLGDSGAILCRNGECLKLSYPHIPKNELEYKRVIQAGGIIQNNRLCHPVWNPGLINIAVTRALGDIYYKNPKYVEDKCSGMIAEPEIVKLVLTKEDEFLVLATDGYWDVMKPQETIDYVKKQLQEGKDSTTICKELTNLALKNATKDDVTVLLVVLQGHNNPPG